MAVSSTKRTKNTYHDLWGRGRGCNDYIIYGLFTIPYQGCSEHRADMMNT